MILQKLPEQQPQAPAEYFDASFSSKRWLCYFHDNKAARVNITFGGTVSLAPELCTPLIRSLQRFQIGETGEGLHLRKFAKLIKDDHYEQCIDMFIKEEQFHARVLAEMITSMNGTLLSWHWTDVAFIALRRMLGLKTELFILLIAEIVGKCFYRLCADQIDNSIISDAFSLIVLDELGHLEFHCSFLRTQLIHLPKWLRYAICYAWTVIFFAACMVFVADHTRTIKALKTKPGKFMRDCYTTFNRATSRSLGL